MRKSGKILNFIFPFLYGKRDYPHSRIGYDKLFDKYSNLSSYYDLIDLHDKKAKQTDINISFSKRNKCENISPKYIVSKYGRPDYKIVSDHGIFKLKIFFYRIMLGTHKVKFELVFLKDRLLYYSYTFSYLNTNEKFELLRMVKKKYNLDQLNAKTDYIVDRNKSIITFSDSIDFTINYIYRQDSGFFRKVRDHRKAGINKEHEKKKKKVKKLFEGL